jgi:hypothetical protein
MRIYAIGWYLIALSTSCMAITMLQSGVFETSFMLWLFCARILGIGGFICGVSCIFQSKWTHGTLLIISALVLPVVSYAIHSSI